MKSDKRCPAELTVYRQPSMITVNNVDQRVILRCIREKDHDGNHLTRLPDGQHREFPG